MTSHRVLRTATVTLLAVWFLVRYPLLTWLGLNSLRLPFVSNALDPIPAGLVPFGPRHPLVFPAFVLLPAFALLLGVVLEWLQFRLARFFNIGVLLVWAVALPVFSFIAAVVASEPDSVAHSLMSLSSLGLQGLLGITVLWLVYRFASEPREPPNNALQRTRYARR